MSKRYATTWHGQPAWALENEALRVVTVPEMGAKIVSLYNKQAGYEWLLSPADRPFRPVPYGASFIAQDMSGWDEMYPTIVTCAYPEAGPYAGAALPDHGEVWALPWTLAAPDDQQITLEVSGRALPYRLSRTLSLRDSATLQMDYSVTNTGDAPFKALWAAHPQFTATASTEIRLPDDISSVIAVQALGDWAPAGTRLDWPQVTRPDGQAIRLDRVTSAAARQSRKVYTPPEQAVAWAMLVETGADHWLRMDWDAARVPYLGIWVDEGQYNPALAIAFEPATGYYDCLTWAIDNQRVPIIPPGEQHAWSLAVTLGSSR